MTNNKETESLLNKIIEGLKEKKGTDIVILDLRKTKGAVCDFFVICNGSSTTQVEALSDSVVKTVRDNLNEKPWHIEGFENKEWILLDYVNVVVHIFLPEIRDYYGIEELWADADFAIIENEI